LKYDRTLTNPIRSIDNSVSGSVKVTVASMKTHESCYKSWKSQSCQSLALILFHILYKVHVSTLMNDLAIELLSALYPNNTSPLQLESPVTSYLLSDKCSQIFSLNDIFFHINNCMLISIVFSIFITYGNWSRIIANTHKSKLNGSA